MRGNGRARCGRRIVALLAAVILLLGLQTVAFAGNAAAHLSVQQTFSTNLPGVDDTFHYILRADETDAPMPKGSVDGEYTFSLSGNASVNLRINATEAGTYRYTLAQDLSGAKEWYEYDKQQYRVVLDVRPDGYGGLSSVLLIYNPAGEKVLSVEFSNSYSQPVPPPPQPIEDSEGGGGDGGDVKTGDENNLSLYLAMMAASALGMALLLVWARKKEKNGEGDENYEK